jgi:hypothetical protein
MGKRGWTMGVLAVLSAACSIVTNLDDLAGDGSTLDAAPDSGISPSCLTLDASACSPAALPAGWSYALLGAGDADCPQDYQRAPLVYDAALGVGACACGCATTGAYSCTGVLSLSSGSSCNNMTKVFNVGNNNACFTTSFIDNHLAAGPLPSASGSPSCHANVTGNAAWTSSTETACVPSCAADFCAAPAPFRRCVMSTTSTACPAPFTEATPLAGTAGEVTVACDTCECDVSQPGPCTADGLAYTTTDCSGTPIAGSDAGIFNGTCFALGAGPKSVSYAPNIPAATCSITAGGDGSVEISNAATICCLP